MTIEEFSENSGLIWSFLKEKLDTFDWINLYHEYKDHVNSYEDIFEDMNDFDDCFDRLRPSDLACKIFYGDGFNPNDDMYSLDAYENLYSCSYREAALTAEEYLSWAVTDEPEWFYDQLAYMNYDDEEIMDWLEKDDAT